jgi:hypothetical protein
MFDARKGPALRARLPGFQASRLPGFQYIVLVMREGHETKEIVNPDVVEAQISSIRACSGFPRQLS